MASSLCTQQVPSQQPPGQGSGTGQEGLLPWGWHKQWSPAPLLRPRDGRAPAMLTPLISQWVKVGQGLESQSDSPAEVLPAPQCSCETGPHFHSNGSLAKGQGLPTRVHRAPTRSDIPHPGTEHMRGAPCLCKLSLLLPFSSLQSDSHLFTLPYQEQQPLSCCGCPRKPTHV